MRKTVYVTVSAAVLVVCLAFPISSNPARMQQSQTIQSVAAVPSSQMDTGADPAPETVNQRFEAASDTKSFFPSGWTDGFNACSELPVAGETVAQRSAQMHPEPVEEDRIARIAVECEELVDVEGALDALTRCLQGRYITDDQGKFTCPFEAGFCKDEYLAAQAKYRELLQCMVERCAAPGLETLPGEVWDDPNSNPDYWSNVCLRFQYVLCLRRGAYRDRRDGPGYLYSQSICPRCPEWKRRTSPDSRICICKSLAEPEVPSPAIDDRWGNPFLTEDILGKCKCASGAVPGDYDQDGRATPGECVCPAHLEESSGRCECPGDAIWLEINNGTSSCNCFTGARRIMCYDGLGVGRPCCRCEEGTRPDPERRLCVPR